MDWLRKLKLSTAVSRSSFQNHSKPGFRKQVESGSEAGLVVLRHKGILDTDRSVLDAPFFSDHVFLQINAQEWACRSYLALFLVL